MFRLLLYPYAMRLPFRYIEPTFFAGLFDDPVLLVHVRPWGKSLLLDCGQMQHLAKRVLKSVAAVFVSHGHMDHFMGFDNLIRNVHVSPRTVEVYGPPGLAEKVCHKFAAYDWNLTERSWCSFLVHELADERTISYMLAGPEGFTCRKEAEQHRSGSLAYRNEYVKMSAVSCDHKGIASMVYRVDELPVFSVDEEKLEQAGFVKGEWLHDLKRALWQPEDQGKAVRALRRRGEHLSEEPVHDPAALYREIRRELEPASIGYMTDIGFTEDNKERIEELLCGVTLLIAECSFLVEHRDKARQSYHLCTDDLNELVKRIRPRYVLPMHFSKNYTGRGELIYEELDFPSGTTLLRLPERIPPRPFLREEGVDLLRIRGS
ncbi:MBL fold metallo-hydrolase [Geobacter sp. DSM 9736]|uniref:ribonuclease Z n=1 Tax=Geobacter sp. DSM 9736 TaxID=1277350 RepID=UPI001E5D7F56|nr:MBL fold metallo-hydrolase [Geobacter sp. DSM 9736]